MKKYIFVLFTLLASTRMFGVGWTPTDAGLVVNLEQGERFLLSVWVDKNSNGTEEDGEEFFVSNYNRYTGGYYGYSAGSFMKLLPASEITEMNEWSVGAPLARGNKALGGITYTIWNDGKTLKTSDNFKFLGDLTSDYNDSKACDVVFVVPTERGVPTVQGRGSLSSFDPNNTLKRGKAPFNGATGTGFLGMTYREVYMFDIPRANIPQSYTNAALVTFNTTLSTWNLTSGAGNIAKGRAAYAYADSKHDKTPRTIFRLYLLDNPINSCSSYFFATDEEDDVRYRMNENNPQKSSDSTAVKTIYTMDRLMCMSRDGSTKYYQTDLMRVPEPDNTYYYVGYDNQYKDDDGESMGTNGAHSLFTNIRELPMKDLPGFKAPAGAYGQMVVDTTSAADNLGVSFEPVGYFLKIKETGKNIRLHKTGDNTWTCEEMWTISGYYASLHIRTMLMTGSEFREDDEGAPVEGWSKWVRGDSVPTSDGESIVGESGYAQITINNTDSNGHMVFILGDNTKWIRYDNNGFMGLEMPLQYPLSGENKVTIMAPRIKPEYTFLGWDTQADGNGTRYQIGDEFTFSSDGETVLYAQARYDGTLQMAISFINPVDSKRYFLTHPNTSAPRYARARHFEHWENTWQGMEDAENNDPNYLSTFELRCPVAEIKKKDAGVTEDLKLQEHVLDPRHYTMKGFVDSLTFYEYFAPNHDEYIGLYYDRSMNTILANNTWAGLFTTTSNATELSWPNYKVPYIDSTKIKSERYVEEYDPKNKKDSLILKNRKDISGWLPAYVQYDPATNQFNGVELEKDGTDFQISAVIVADEHYIVLPDTTYEWRDTINFGYHHGEQMSEDVWSALIGKQLMAVMTVDGDTVYFHPNRKKIINDPNNLYLSSDFRLTQLFELIHDSRVSTALSEGDSAKLETTSHYWHYNIVSGLNTPMGVQDAGGNYIDIIDTFRITLSQGGISKIKEYRGRWKNGAAGLKVNMDGSRCRDIIVRTRTYHYGETQSRLVLTPKKESYSFSPIAGQSQQLNFILTRESYRELFNAQGAFVQEEVLSVDTVTTRLALSPGACSFSSGSPGAYFSIDNEKTTGDHITLVTKEENTSGVNYDTLTVTVSSITIEGKTYTNVSTRVPLMQAALASHELIWSVMHGGQRYYIMAADGNLIFRQYTLQNSILYKLNTRTHLVKDYGAASETQYITPWVYAYVGEQGASSGQLTLKTEYTLNKYFGNDGSTGTLVAGAAALTYHIVETYTNPNANYEEQVRLQFGPSQWLQFTGSAITLTDDEDAASLFSWSYLLTEYNLLNNGKYPSQNEAVFDYNSASPKSIQTRYKAYREYSTLLNNQVTYLCRKEETRIDSLTSASREWLTTCTVDTLRDRRTATSSGLNNTHNATTLTTTVTPSTAVSPTNVMYGGKYIDIVDTLRVRFELKGGAPAYRFKGDWSSFKSISDANLKIPLIRKTYHTRNDTTMSCIVENEESRFIFPATITEGVNDEHEYILSTFLNTAIQILDVDNNVVATTDKTHTDVTNDVDASNKGMHLNVKELAEVRLMDEYGNAPAWCKLTGTTANTVTVQCLEDGVRSPRSAYLYLAYIVITDGKTRFVNHRLTVSQVSSFTYANNQQLIHSNGASGDAKMADGRQQVHENKRILYYYPDQDTELPVRERAFYGWWRWYREGVDIDSVDVSDTDVPDSLWRVKPINTGKYDFPFRIIGDSVWVDENDHSKGKKLVTMGRWTVFHYRSKDYGNKSNPPSKNPRVVPPDTMRTGANRGKHATLTYAVDISNYYDNLPLSVKDKNQVDRALMDTMLEIIEPTLSLREIFELHPWTEMADTMEHYKSSKDGPFTADKYMEDHEVMAPTGAPLLLQTEQRYIYEHLLPKYDKNGTLIDPGHSESLLGYYMRDDNWSSMSAAKDEDGWSRQDSMIWCGGWDADCKWYTYNPNAATPAERYTACTHSISDEDFLKVPATSTNDTTVYYCLRARSKKSPVSAPDPEEPEDGDYWFNICRYKIIYHSPNTYGPKMETTVNKVTKAIITNDEIEQRYEVLERLNFDYIKPGSAYHIYPHPLPWADASYGYTYPETSDLPHNRYHDESDFPNHGEYGLINRIPYSAYWHKMEQHGGAANGYMIYCDGMASAGQVAALTLNTQLCEGQKMYFSGYVGNPSNQKGKSNPNFTFSVQGSSDGSTWEDITSYMTGDIAPSTQWYQIVFPINHNRADGKAEYTHFRVRIYNVAADFDGNDFVIDDMCVYATKPPLVAYQADTKCVESAENDSIEQVVLRIDYQGFNNEDYNDEDIYYTVEKEHNGHYSYVPMEDGYLNGDTIKGKTTPEVTPDTIYGVVHMPSATYEPTDEDSIYSSLSELIDRFNETANTPTQVKQGYIYDSVYENGKVDVRPVMWIVHQAKMASSDTLRVRMAATSYRNLMSSICAMTSQLTISSRMVLELNGEEQPGKEIVGMCANTTYDISMRVKSLTNHPGKPDPVDVTGHCVNDWLLFGDTTEAPGSNCYGHYYSDIVKVVKDILRADDASNDNNRLARNLSEVNRNLMIRMQGAMTLKEDITAYDLLADLVNKGFLTLYEPKITATLMTGDSLQYVVFPIIGTGTEDIRNAHMEVCPNPVFIKLKPEAGGTVPLVLGGVHRNATQKALPITVLADELTANNQIALRIDSIASSSIGSVAIHSVELRPDATDDPECGDAHIVRLLPDREWNLAGGSAATYYRNGDTLYLQPAPNNNYRMRAGYNYTFNINLMKRSDGSLTLDPEDPTSCRVGIVPFTVSVVPDYLRWNPKSADSYKWNNPDNWVGVNAANQPLHEQAHFAPLASSHVIIPTLEDGLPYPVLSDPHKLSSQDSVKKIGFEYNSCNVIRFMPHAAMANQQQMNYTEAVVDMSTPHGKWALRAAPVAGMLSGDLYMADADLSGGSSLWEVGEFDASGRSASTGNASFWLSQFSQQSIHIGNNDNIKNDTVAANTTWAQVTNAMTLSLPPASGWAVYTKTASEKEAAVRLPKNDDIYYYYNRDGEKRYDQYEQNLQALRDEFVVGEGKAGTLAFNPASGTHRQAYDITNAEATNTFVFGNPTMGYIDIWGFIADNTGLSTTIGYIGTDGNYTTISKSAAEYIATSPDTITNLRRYLPPMQAIVLTKTGDAGATLSVNLDSCRVLTAASQKSPAAAPRRMSASGRRQGIMTVTAINPVSSRCTSRLLIGQGYHNAIRDGEDAILTTINIDKYSTTSAPATPFNIYASDGGYGLSIDLRDEVLNIPVSFYMTELTYAPQTQLWFTGVNNIDGELVLYDALTGGEQRIIDGLCIKIPTPEQSHEARYYIRRRGFDPSDTTAPVATDVDEASRFEMDGAAAVKIIQDGHVLILRDGHVYTMFGQKLR